MLDGMTGRLVKGWTPAALSIWAAAPPHADLRHGASGYATSGTVRGALTGAPVGDIPDGATDPLACASGVRSRGDAGRNSARGPQQFPLDAAVTRTFQVNQWVRIDCQRPTC
jgi:hypothetical protein